MRRTVKIAFIAAALLATAVAQAQDVALPDSVEAPTTKQATKNEGEPEVAIDFDREIDLSNVVTAAAKGVTTVQEAPAIITIITSDEIRARGFKHLMEALSTVPGWYSQHALGNQIEMPAVRGVGQAMLFMRDGLSLYEPFGNVPWMGRTQPLETVKRIEVVTGPGGVLWGANSFLGVANLITKDAEDVNGLELSAGYGDGPGNKQDFKAYALFGKSFFNGRLKIFQHVSFESFIGETYDVPQILASSPAPQPGGNAYYAANAPRDPERSWMVIVDGKVSAGPFSLYYMVPFSQVHDNLGFASDVETRDTWNHFDRYGVLEYKDRFLKDRIGVSAKAYAVQFVRQYGVELYPASTFFPKTSPSDPGGLAFTIQPQQSFRFGGTVDLDFKLPFDIRLLAGGELFYEGIRNSTQTFSDPVDPNLLPILCPVDEMGNRIPNCPRQYIFDTGRYVAAGYVDAQWHPFQKLTLDGGVRIQAGLGALAYNLVPLGSAAIVYNFLPDYHLKLNYATGFRAPVFQATSTAPGGVGYGANPNLQTESSQSFQAELNGRLLRNVRKIRELELRVDYSYTLLSRLIQIRNGAYGNSGTRGMHSVEGYARLYLNGDHSLYASYTFLRSTTSDAGIVRAEPNHWIVLGGSFNIVKQLLDVNINLNIYGAYEDPNRVPGGTATGTGGMGTGFTGTTSAATSDLTLDRLTPVADLQLGFRLRFLHDKLQFSAQFYNVLNQRYWYPDFFYDLTPTVEVAPNPAPGFNFFASVNYHF